MHHTTPRALIGRINANNADATAILAKIQSAFTEFRAGSDERLTNMEAALERVMAQSENGTVRANAPAIRRD